MDHFLYDGGAARARPRLNRSFTLMMVLLCFMWSSAPAGAIGSDNGWTHGANNNYIEGSTNPECQPGGGGQGCRAWSDDAAHGLPWPNVNVNITISGPICCGSGTYEGNARYSLNTFVNPTSPPSIGNYNSPLLFEGNYGGSVTVNIRYLGTDICGRTTSYGVDVPPTNHGCCQQVTMTSAEVSLNTYPTVFYRDNGVFNSTNECELRRTYNHEFFHSLGLGHTVNPAQTMYVFRSAVYSAMTGDRNGASCIYQLVNC